MPELSPRVSELLSLKGSPARFDATIERVVDLATRFLTAFEVDVDGTLAPFTLDPQQSTPRPGVIDGLNALRIATPFTEVLSGRDAAYFAAKLPDWGLTGIGVAALYGSQLMTWDDDVPSYEPSAEALDGEERVNRILIPINAALEERHIKVRSSAKPGALTIEFKAHMINFQMSYLDSAQRGLVKEAFATSAVQQALTDNGLWILEHESGSIEVMSITADKEELTVDRQRRNGARRFVFFCDDTGDITLAQRIHSEKIGIVVAVYNAPDKSGRAGTPIEILEAADVVMVGGEVAAQLGFAGIPVDALPQDRTGEFMQAVAAKMNDRPPLLLGDLSVRGNAADLLR